MPHQYPRRAESWWRQTVADFRRSGLSPADFAASVRAHPATLRWWNRRFNDAGNTRACPDGAAPVSGALATSPFVRVEVARLPAAEPAVVCTVQAAGVALRFFAGSDPSFAGALVGALAKAATPC